MIDAPVYARLMAKMVDRFNRRASETMLRDYFDLLSARLSTADFEHAVGVIYVQDDYFPSPRRFLEVAGKDAKGVAARAWEEALALARKGETRPPEDPALAAGVRALGGLAAIGRTDERSLAFRRGDFVDAVMKHVEAAEPRPALLDEDPRRRLSDGGS